MFPERIWFDVALMLFVYAIGLILFGQFDAQPSRARRIVKVVLTTGLVLVLSSLFGRIAVFALLAIAITGVAIIHAWYLPKHGINGFTGEPKENYDALRQRGLLESTPK